MFIYITMLSLKYSIQNCNHYADTHFEAMKLVTNDNNIDIVRLPDIKLKDFKMFQGHYIYIPHEKMNFEEDYYTPAFTVPPKSILFDMAMTEAHPEQHNDPNITISRYCTNLHIMKLLLQYQTQRAFDIKNFTYQVD